MILSIHLQLISTHPLSSESLSLSLSLILFYLFACRNSSGLPFYDIMLIEGLPKSASLPVASVQTTKARIMNGTWSQFDYIFFTESDQILMMRPVEEMYAYLNQHPRHLMVPHRLMTYPASVSRLFHSLSWDLLFSPRSKCYGVGRMKTRAKKSEHRQNKCN